MFLYVPNIIHATWWQLNATLLMNHWPLMKALSLSSTRSGSKPCNKNMTFWSKWHMDIPRFAKGQNKVHSKWVYKVKLATNCIIIHFKVCLVTKVSLKRDQRLQKCPFHCCTFLSNYHMCMTFLYVKLTRKSF
jgi:hypothetical protein